MHTYPLAAGRGSWYKSMVVISNEPQCAVYKHELPPILYSIGLGYVRGACEQEENCRG